MRALVQRVDGARVTVGGDVVGQISGPGLLVLVGVTHTDSPREAAALARKVYQLRIFDADALPLCRPPGGSAEVSAADGRLPVLVISQFTLYGSTQRGRRPTWEAAAPRSAAEPLVAAVAAEFRTLGAEVATGVFGADMRVSLVNDGPMTLLVQA